jgi:hypothetical protein
MKFSGAMAAAVLALGLSASGALALPPGGALNNEPAGAGSLVEKVHGCHRVCRLGPAGWHFHAGPACVRVACVAHPGGPWTWHCEGNVCGWWHPSRRAWWK